MILLLLACIPSPTDLPAPEWEPVLLPPHNLGSTGSDLHAAGDVNGDGYDDILVGDCSAHTASLYYGSAQGASSSPDWQERGLGACHLAAPGDVNGDGYADLLVGAPSDNSDAGTVRLYGGSGSGPVLQQSWSGAPGEQLGTGLFGLGDLNGDGYNDLGITAWTAEDASTNGLGRLEVYYGAATLSATADWSYQYQTTAGSSLFANAPLAVVGLERQGDGYGDLAIGGTWDDGAGEPNTLLFYHGSASGLQAGSSQKLWLSEGELELRAADLDGDSLNGLLVVAEDYILDESSYFSIFAGPISSLRPVDLDGNGRDELVMVFPEGGSGSQTSRYLLGVYESGVTKPWLGMTTASVVVPMGDINGDGSLDAALWHGDLSLVYGSRDADGDGFDSDGSATFGQDCNDQDATINPGSVETAGDGRDSDCDGLDGPATTVATCIQFTTAAEAKLLLDPDVLPLPDFSSLEAAADACGSRMDAPTASLCDTPNSSCWSVSSAWVRSACTETADGVDADGLYQDEARSSSSYDGGDSSYLQERLQLRALKVAVDPASGADPYAGVVVDREATSSSRRAENIGNMGTESYGTSSYFRQLGGYAMRQDGSTEDFRLSYVTSDSSENVGAWSGWFGSTSTTSSSVHLNFEQGSCTLGGSLSSVSEAMGGMPLDYAYDAVVTDGVHTVKVRNGVDLEVCGQNFWGLLAGGWPIEQDSYGWAELDGVGQVVSLATWEPAPGDSDGDGWPGSLGDCDDTDATINPCALDTAGVDHNCDGQVSTAPAVDQDGDGEDAGIDCNDMDATIFSGATEGIADDVDSNCDGQELCYADSDQDGHGDANALQLSTDSDCLDAGESYGDDDCKDSDPMVHPGSFDAPGNGVDDDCDGVEG